MGNVDQVLRDLPKEIRLKQAKLLVSPTGVLHDPGWRGFFNGVESFFTSHPSNRTFECMWTHFAMELFFDGGTVAILERTPDGVRFTQRYHFQEEYETWSEEPHHTITITDVLFFFCRETALPYSFVGKNCKHFAYDFMAEVFHQRGLGDFGNWCRPFEDVWKELTHHEF